MHEYSIMVDIVQAALNALEGYDVENVDSVFLDVGGLTFLNFEQLRFTFKVLSENNILQGSELVIREMKAEIHCPSCGYQGGLPDDVEEIHFGLPRIFCPQCKGKVNLLKGKECILRNIKMNVRDDGGTSSDG
ncbi:MAG: hydrogenase maturation nickel metallochaperone HypA [Thermoplasmata archaeon]|nr:MAG: hydrogenase maturation nickel metallochaperone HypA [Thermoplasmata archaeon]